MATNDTIFFSYSRDDSDFVLNLAKNLRKAEATIWLDQLDIKPGTRWDASIEKALDSSSVLLVILSNSSVISNNVLDEVSYALEEKKTVVPVLLEECDIPFRLRRLQYADFTGDHKTGIATLIKALDLDDNVAHKLADASLDNPEEVKKVIKQTVKGTAATSNQKTPPTTSAPGFAPPKSPVTEAVKPKQHYTPPAKQSSSNTILYIIGGIVIGGGLMIFLIIGLVAMFDEDPVDPNPNIVNTDPNNITPTSGNDAVDWQTATQTNTLDSYITYLYTYGKAAQNYTAAYDNINSFLPNDAYVRYGVEGVERYFDKHLYYFGDELSLPQADDIITPRFQNDLYSNTSFNPKNLVVLPGHKLVVLSVFVDEDKNVWCEVGYY